MTERNLNKSLVLRFYTNQVYKWCIELNSARIVLQQKTQQVCY